MTQTTLALRNKHSSRSCQDLSRVLITTSSSLFSRNQDSPEVVPAGMPSPPRHPPSNCNHPGSSHNTAVTNFLLSEPCTTEAELIILKNINIFQHKARDWKSPVEIQNYVIRQKKIQQPSEISVVIRMS